MLAGDVLYSTTNRHFQDTRYYLERAATSAKTGANETIDPLRRRLEALLGSEAEPEPTRAEALRGEMRDVAGRARRTARETLERARRRFGRDRSESDSA